MLERMKQRVKEKSQQQAMRETGGMPTSASFHRRAYHRNFEGYTEIKRVNSAGKTVIDRIYTGKYYEPDLSPANRIKLRILYVLLFLGGTSLYLFAAFRPALCNTVLYVNLFQALSIPMLLWCIYLLIFYLPATGKLTIGSYNTLHKPLIRASCLTCLCMWATALTSVICYFLHFSTNDFLDLLCAAGFAISGALIFLIYYLEVNLNYTVSNSTEQIPEGGVEIDCD